MVKEYLIFAIIHSHGESVFYDIPQCNAYIRTDAYGNSAFFDYLLFLFVGKKIIIIIVAVFIRKYNCKDCIVMTCAIVTSSFSQ